MLFGKRGRPPEDRLARQREIYTAVAPLIEREGVRRLSMRQAAAAACLSIGGLYHYFPTKRELVLWTVSRSHLEEVPGLPRSVRAPGRGRLAAVYQGRH
ncbi:MAG: helix-turn-helix transcriptional regulator [Kouleothrix sp.]|nr:helix-turn-helix transcriptional regulator [Kouleothrix sp.]